MFKFEVDDNPNLKIVKKSTSQRPVDKLFNDFKNLLYSSKKL